MQCKWCEEEIVMKIVSVKPDHELEGGDDLWVWLHLVGNGKYRAPCTGLNQPWRINFGRNNWAKPSVATPNYEDELNPRLVRAAERGLRNLLRQL